MLDPPAGREASLELTACLESTALWWTLGETGPAIGSHVEVRHDGKRVVATEATGRRVSFTWLRTYLNQVEQRRLKLAERRRALEQTVRGGAIPPLVLDDYVSFGNRRTYSVASDGAIILAGKPYRALSGGELRALAKLLVDREIWTASVSHLMPPCVSLRVQILEPMTFYEHDTPESALAAVRDLLTARAPDLEPR